MNLIKVIILNLSLLLFFPNAQATNTFTTTDILISHSDNLLHNAHHLEQNLVNTFKHKNIYGYPYLNKVSGKNKADSHTTSPIIHSVSIENQYDHQLIELRFHLLEETSIKIAISDTNGELIRNYFAKGLKDANIFHLSTLNLNTGRYQIVLSAKDTSVYHQIDISKKAPKPRA